MSKTNSWYAYSGLKYVQPPYFQHLVFVDLCWQFYHQWKLPRLETLSTNEHYMQFLFIFTEQKRINAQTMQKTQLYSKSTSRIQSFCHWKFHYRQECFFEVEHKNLLMEIIPSSLSVPILKTLELDFYDERRFISLCFNLRHFRHLIIEMGTSDQQRFGKFHKIGLN